MLPRYDYYEYDERAPETLSPDDAARVFESSFVKMVEHEMDIMDKWIPRIHAAIEKRNFAKLLYLVDEIYRDVEATKDDKRIGVFATLKSNISNAIGNLQPEHIPWERIKDCTIYRFAVQKPEMKISKLPFRDLMLHPKNEQNGKNIGHA